MKIKISNKSFCHRLSTLACCFIVLITFPNTSQATAIYNASILTDLRILTDVETNLFGFAEFGGNDANTIEQAYEQIEINTQGNAQASAEAISSTILTNPPVFGGIIGVSRVDGRADGVVGTPAHAMSFANTYGKINLANLSGSGGVTPPGQIFQVDLELSFNWSILADVDDLVAEMARALIHYDVSVAGAIIEMDTQLVVANAQNQAANIINFQVDLPANSITSVELRTWAIGDAWSTKLPDPPPPPPPAINPPPFTPIPEASLFLLLLFGLLEMIFYAKKLGDKNNGVRPYIF